MPEEFNNLVHVKNNTCQAAYIGNLGDVKRCIEKNDYNGAIKELDKVYKEKREIALEFGKKYKVQFDKKNIAINIMNLFYSK